MQQFMSRVLIAGWIAVAADTGPAAAQVFVQHNLVSDGAVPADLVDPDLVNAWGLTAGPTTPWWVANNETGTSTLYDGNTGAKLPLTVTVPGNPTGAVFHNGAGFVVTDGMASGPAVFLFASEDGTISGWNPAVPPPPFSSRAFVVVDNSASGAVYKGLAIGSTAASDRLYATNFSAGTVDVFDSAFTSIHMPGAFTDASIPAGYAPFGIANLRGTLFVTYALQDTDKQDDVAGQGHGFVDAFDTSGHLLRRVASMGALNSPWGLAIAPESFGKFRDRLLVGNFGDGHIHAFKPEGFKPDDFEGDDMHHHHGPPHGPLRGLVRGPHGPHVSESPEPLRDPNGAPITIDGLWALAFGNGSAAGPTSTLFFTAGPFDESHGLFGTLNAVPRADDDDRDDDEDDDNDRDMD